MGGAHVCVLVCVVLKSEANSRTRRGGTRSSLELRLRDTTSARLGNPAVAVAPPGLRRR